MNFSMIIFILGRLLLTLAVLLLLPLLVALIYREGCAVAIGVTIGICAAAGLLLSRRRPRNRVLQLRDGFTATAFAWIMISVVGSLPFLISGEISNPVDAIFETVSGFTTTGASILYDVEAMSHGLLFWRSFTHWIGGMGVLVFLLSITSLSGGSHVNLMKAESPGPQVEKLAPTVQSTAKILYGIYIFLTVLEMIFLLAGGMPLFDAATISFGTAGTGGFGVRNDSIASYSPYLQTVITVFMIMFGVNFNFYFFLLMRKFRRAVMMEEVRVYAAIILAAIAVITINIHGLYDHISTALLHASFQVGSIITTTGFTTTNYDVWPEASKAILVLLMFIGACAGSTGGGVKVSRCIILFKTMRKELRRLLHPMSVKKIALDGKSIAHEVVRSTNVFMFSYILIFVVSVLVISFDGFDFTSNFTAVAATLNNIGPGLGAVGPAQNFAGYSALSKLVLIFDMLAGRLELFPLLLLFTKANWQKF